MCIRVATNLCPTKMLTMAEIRASEQAFQLIRFCTDLIQLSNAQQNFQNDLTKEILSVKFADSASQTSAITEITE